MFLIEYEDCLSIKFSDVPDHIIDRKGEDFDIVMPLVNGRETEITLVELRLINSEVTESLARKKGLDPKAPGSLARLLDHFGPMPEVFIEKEVYGVKSLMSPSAKITAVAERVSCLKELAPHHDCVRAAIYFNNYLLCSLYVWPNPSISGSDRKAVETVWSEFESFGAHEVFFVDDVAVFEACGCCGKFPPAVIPENNSFAGGACGC